jgi:hypothetical protein
MGPSLISVLYGPKMTRKEWIIVGLVGGVCVVLLALSLEEHFLSTPAHTMLVKILSSDGPQESEGPPAYRYEVELPDGSKAHFVSRHLYNAGLRVRATCSEGRLTRIVRLRDPSALESEAR